MKIKYFKNFCSLNSNLKNKLKELKTVRPVDFDFKEITNKNIDLSYKELH